MTVDSYLTVRNSVFCNNDVYSGVGIAIYSEFDPMLIENCMFYDNTADEVGGALDIGSETSPIIQDCTINGDNAEYGGAICVYEAAPTIKDSIFWGNTGTTAGNEIHILFSGSPTVSYSIVQGGYTGTMSLNSGPLCTTGSQGDYYLSSITAGQGFQPLACLPFLGIYQRLRHG